MEDFYQLIQHGGSSAEPISLQIVSSEKFESFTSSDKYRAEFFGFELDAPSIWPLGNGRVETVLVSTGEAVPSASDPWWMAGICEKLPEGAYQFANDVDDEILAAGALGWLLTHYRFDRYDTKSKPVPQRTLLLPTTIDLEKIVQEAISMALVRDLVNTPAEDMGPANLQAVVEQVAAEFDASCETIIGDDLLEQNFPSIHAVGRAAVPSRAPRLIDLKWGSQAHPLVTLVGKGVCFDSGGLGLKPGAFMVKMKKDMAGAAHALGLARMIMMAKLPVRLRLLLPAVDNNVSKESYRPGDVLDSRKGITIEIDHTDAEGRLVLCDALALASEEEPDLIFDFATLTGANTNAVGPDMSGVYTDHDELWSAIERGSKNKGDPVWRMPLWAPYGKKLKSNIADINHRTPGFNYAGGTTAALFLQNFVSPKSQWAHFDFYAWHDDALPGRPIGCAVMGIRAVFDAICQITEG